MVDEKDSTCEEASLRDSWRGPDFGALEQRHRSSNFEATRRHREVEAAATAAMVAAVRICIRWRIMGLKLTPELKTLIDGALMGRHPIAVAYVDETGQPVLSFRGSTQAFSDDQLAIWVRNGDGNLLRAIKRNPKVALMYRDEDSRATYTFRGRARISTDEADRARVYETMAQAEKAHDPSRAGTALIIDLDLVEGWAGMGASGQIGRVRMVRGED
jgi:hypothetical protein